MIQVLVTHSYAAGLAIRLPNCSRNIGHGTSKSWYQYIDSADKGSVCLNENLQHRIAFALDFKFYIMYFTFKIVTLLAF
jgi:hypothetical protein